MKFPKQKLLDMLDDAKFLEDNIVDTSRWSIHHEVVFEHEGKFYRSSYSVGATEYQDETPWENDADKDGNIECPEVQRVEKVTYAYVEVKQ